MSTAKVILSMVLMLFARTVGRVAYLMGAKPALSSDSSSFHLSDCSGFVRWILDRAGFRFPLDGSANMHEWCAANLRAVSYRDAATMADPSRLFIAFIAPSGGEAGHVWLLHSAVMGQGRTLECHGHGGVSSRPWDCSALAAVCACYELPVNQEALHISPE